MAKKSVRPKSVTTKTIRIPKRDELNRPPEDFHSYCTLLMGAKGIGKTTASSTFPDNLNLMWEPRRKNVPIRMIGADQGLIFKTAQEILDGEPDPWPIFVEINAQAVQDPTVQTITWDTIDIAYNACFEHVCASKGVTHPNEVEKDFGQTWNEIKNKCIALIDTIRETDTGLLFISHVKEREQEYQDVASKLSIVGPSATPACIQIMKSSCDFWFYYGYVDNQRTVIVRDPDRIIDVACGCGFEGINEVTIGEDWASFYGKISNAFKGETRKRIIKPVKKAKKKGVKKKAS